MKIEDHFVKVAAFERAMAKFDGRNDWRLHACMIEKAATHCMNIALHAWKHTPVFAEGAADLAIMEKPRGAAFKDAARYQVMADRGDLIHARFKSPDTTFGHRAQRLFQLMEFFEQERERYVRQDVPFSHEAHRAWHDAYSEVRAIAENAVRTGREQ